MPMNILIPTIGSRGDVQPFIALIQSLVRAGHNVTLASHPVMRSLVESHGVTFAPIGPDIDLTREVAAIRYRSRNVIVGLVRAMRFGFNLLECSHEDIFALCCKADLVVVPAAIASGKNEADQFYWGQRVHQLGVGLPFIPSPKLTRARLGAALGELITNTGLHSAASALGEQICSEARI